jgi:hypothetical protein
VQGDSKDYAADSVSKVEDFLQGVGEGIVHAVSSYDII